MMPVTLCIPFSFFRSCDDTLAMLVYAICWLYMHLYMLAHMFMHESCLLVCHPYFNTMKLRTFNPNLYLFLVDTISLFVFLLVCLFSCLLACLFAFLPSCLFVYLCLSCLPPHAMLAISILLVCFCSLCALSMHLFLSIACLLVSCLCLYMYTHRVRAHGSRARSPRRKQNG